MTLEIANRLVEYRKKFNFSQEEVAEKIGVSRQAVSKWERAEASPDTDNLIALATLYGVSLDELVFGKTPEPESKSHPGTITVEKGKKTVVIDGISPDGHLFSAEDRGIHIHVNEDWDDDEDDEDDDDDDDDGHGFSAEINLGYGSARSPVHRFFRAFPFPALALIAYLVFGFLDVCGGWAYGWLVFLLVPIYYSLVESIICRKADELAFPVFVTLVYLWCGFEYGLWHPMWVLFLTIPFYYFICEFISKLRNKNEKE